MKKKTFFIYITFIFTKTLLGLTLHPYKSTVEALRRPILLPVVLTPFVGIIILFIAAKAASLYIVVYGLKREAIAMFLSTTLISIIFWQALLIYLLISFTIASQKNRR